MARNIRNIIEIRSNAINSVLLPTEICVLAFNEDAKTLRFDVIAKALDMSIEVNGNELRANLTFKEHGNDWTAWYAHVARRMGSGARTMTRGLDYIRSVSDAAEAVEELMVQTHNALFHIREYKAKARTMLLNPTIPTDIAHEVLRNVFGKKYDNVAHASMNEMLAARNTPARRRLEF